MEPARSLCLRDDPGRFWAGEESRRRFISDGWTYLELAGGRVVRAWTAPVCPHPRSGKPRCIVADVDAPAAMSHAVRAVRLCHRGCQRQDPCKPGFAWSRPAGVRRLASVGVTLIWPAAFRVAEGTLRGGFLGRRAEAEAGCGGPGPMGSPPSSQSSVARRVAGAQHAAADLGPQLGHNGWPTAVIDGSWRPTKRASDLHVCKLPACYCTASGSFPS
jgi:hypothetical protein